MAIQINIPKHIAIIMDGNGRWAENHNKPRTYGHRAGHTSVLKIVRECARLNVSMLTLFAFSSENWKRPQSEVEALMFLFSQAIKSNRRLFLKHNIRFNVIGDTSLFSEKLRKQIKNLELETAEFNGLIVNIAANYGGKWDIVNACKQLTTKVVNKSIQLSDITEDSLNELLTTYPVAVDLLIRTGGEQRISNFLLWQIAYAELYFTETLWPDFDESALNKAIDVFSSRIRRFGGLIEKNPSSENDS